MVNIPMSRSAGHFRFFWIFNSYIIQFGRLRMLLGGCKFYGVPKGGKGKVRLAT